MGKKRERVYIDQSKMLNASSKKPNFIVGINAIAIIDKKLGHNDRHFTHKLVHSTSPDCAAAYVLPNNICVMTLVAPENVSSVSYHLNCDEVVVSGKKKKGAHKIKAGDVLLTLHFSDGSSRNIQSPIGGKLIEINESLKITPGLLSEPIPGSGFIAVIYPDTQLPKPSSSTSINWDRLQQEMSGKSNVCFAWMRRSCTRGSNCRFKHDLPPSEISGDEAKE